MQKDVTHLLPSDIAPGDLLPEGARKALKERIAKEYGGNSDRIAFSIGKRVNRDGSEEPRLIAWMDGTSTD